MQTISSDYDLSGPPKTVFHTAKVSVVVTSPKLTLMATLIGEASSNIRPTEFREPVAAHSQCADYTFHQ